jgi:hypothetical protein
MRARAAEATLAVRESFLSSCSTPAQLAFMMADHYLEALDPTDASDEARAARARMAALVADVDARRQFVSPDSAAIAEACAGINDAEYSLTLALSAAVRAEQRRVGKRPARSDISFAAALKSDVLSAARARVGAGLRAYALASAAARARAREPDARERFDVDESLERARLARSKRVRGDDDVLSYALALAAPPSKSPRAKSVAAANDRVAALARLTSAAGPYTSASTNVLTRLTAPRKRKESTPATGVAASSNFRAYLTSSSSSAAASRAQSRSSSPPPPSRR